MLLMRITHHASIFTRHSSPITHALHHLHHLHHTPHSYTESNNVHTPHTSYSYTESKNVVLELRRAEDVSGGGADLWNTIGAVMYVCIYKYICMYIYVYIHMAVHACVCVVDAA